MHFWRGCEASSNAVDPWIRRPLKLRRFQAVGLSGLGSMSKAFDLRLAAVLLVAGLVLPATAMAQFEALPGLGGGAAGAAPSPIAVRAVIVPAEGDQPVRLAVTADIEPGWNTYSITQPPGGQVRTKVKV